MACTSLSRSYGLPEIISTDNSLIFGSIDPEGMSKLTLWWISLDIDEEFITPASPQENGQDAIIGHAGRWFSRSANNARVRQRATRKAC